jgi:Carboxypeptidase regulatory-like domain
MRRQLTWALLALLGFGPLAIAQVSTTGQITVVITGQDGTSQPGVMVRAISKDTITKREAVTNSQGEATLVSLDPSAEYTVTGAMSGFSSVKQSGILVRSGQTTPLRFTMAVSSLSDEVTVVAETPVVDTSSAATGQDITLALTESLPTGRTYQSYLQLVPGVMPEDPTLPGNPASKSGINYSDIAGDVGVSTDNFYYFDGINVTDPYSGTFGANLNTEIIQEQRVLTGGIPAEFVGTPGLLSTVVTKSGTNTYHGTVNYFFQNDGLVSANKNAPDETFSRYDTALTLGGPIVQDKAWFFGSYRRLNQTNDVTSLDTNALLRTVENKQNQWYGKATWSPTAKDTMSFTFINDPTDISGSRERTRSNGLDFARVQGGNNFSGSYSHLFKDVILDLRYAKHNGEVSNLSAIRQARNSVSFAPGSTRSIADEQQGGFGIDSIDTRDGEIFSGSAQWNLNRHTIKAGVEYARNTEFVNDVYLGPRLTSIGTAFSGATAADVVDFSNIVFDYSNPSDFSGLIDTINGRSDRAAFYNAFDTNHNGTITPDELGQALRFNSTAGNPQGQINYSRTVQAEVGPQDYKSTGLSVFLQDSIKINRLTMNLGVRTERFRHFATTGEITKEFDWTFAPRLSAVFDLTGDGKQKLTAYYGKYYDPIRLNMTQFAGTFSGTVLSEEVFALGQWVPYRIRGGAQQPDALFAPSIKTPWTDDLQFGYQIDLGRSMSFEALYTKRRTRDILEDFDLSLYAYDTDGVTTIYPGPLNDPQSLWLGFDYFGYTANPGSNFVIGTLPDGKRDYQGIEFSFRKRYSNHWQALASYTHNMAKGNSNSDSNADFQGDVLFLDPRAPNQYSDQPGSIPHLFKVAASYKLDMGLEFGAFYRWNSGTLASRTFRSSGRNLPIRVATADAFTFAGINARWIAPDTVGELQNPSWGQLDLRLQYTRKFNKIGGEFFVDIFNATDNQGSIRNQDLVAGLGTVLFSQPIRYNDPRRFFLGARLNF